MFENETSGSAGDESTVDTGTGEAQAIESEEIEEGAEEGAEGEAKLAPKAPAKAQAKPGAEPAAGEKTVEQQIAELSEEDLDKMVVMNVNGEKKRVTVRQAIKWGQLGDAAYGKMRATTQREQQLTQLFTLAQENPREFFRMTGKDAREFAEAVLLEEIQREAMTPEQRELAEHRAEKAARAKEAEEREAAEKQTKEQEDRKKESVAARTKLIEAWSKTGLPPDERFGAWIAATVIRQRALGVELPMEEAAAIVRDDFHGHIRDHTSKLDPQALEKLLGAETLKKWRDFDVKRVTQKAPLQPASQNRPANSAASAQANKKSKPMSELEFLKFMES